MRGFKTPVINLTEEQTVLQSAARAAQKNYMLRQATTDWINPQGLDITAEDANATIEAWNAVSPEALKLKSV